jgi:hypothetical protein
MFPFDYYTKYIQIVRGMILSGSSPIEITHYLMESLEWRWENEPPHGAIMWCFKEALGASLRDLLGIGGWHGFKQEGGHLKDEELNSLLMPLFDRFIQKNKNFKH